VTGTIPAELGDLAALEILDLSDNQLSGSIPPTLGNLSSLETVDFSGNQLSGTIPSALGNLSHFPFSYLDLGSNELSGQIPSELSQLQYLGILNLAGNQLTGQIPPGLSQLQDLFWLFLTGNQLSGQIPSELSQLQNLNDLHLGFNQLTGQIPSELGQLSSLVDLQLQSNELTGAIPVSFTNLTSMSDSDDGTFYFNDTDLCEPPDSDFQDWLDSIDDVESTGVMCSDSGGLLAHYLFDGNANDASGNGNDGTLNGNPQFVEGQEGQAISLDGDGDFVQTAPSSSLKVDEKLTFAAWVFVDLDSMARKTLAVQGTNVDTDGNWEIRVRDDGSFTLGNNNVDGGARSDGGIPVRQWHHVAITFSGGTTKFYIDGALDSEKDFGASSFNTTSDGIKIGDREYTGDETDDFKGEMDEVRLYDRALTEEEVQELYDGGGGNSPTITSVEPDPVPGSDEPQPFTINGSDYEEGANVTLRDRTNDEEYPNREISSFSPTEIVINPTFTTDPATWSVEVINPSGDSSGEYEFEVVAPDLPASSDFAYPISSTETATEANDGDGWRNAQDFGVSNSDFDGKVHLGEDWNAESGGDTDCGLSAYAASGGTIVYAGDAAPSLGKTVVLRHQLPDGSEVESLYAHLNSISRTSGTVSRREKIGTIGDAGGYYPNCHLHFAVRLPSSSDWGNPGPGYAASTDGWTDPSDYIDGNTAAPSGLAATPSDGNVALSWDPSGSPDGYNVYRATGSFSDISTAEKINDSLVENESYTDGAANGGTTYYYRVTAVGADGTESGPSGQASVALQSLQLLGLEVNQSVQTWNNSVPLIEGKKTIVRVHLQNKREGRTPVNVSLIGSRNGALLELPTLISDNYEAPPSPSPPEDSVETIRKRRAEMEKSLNFEVPESWTQEPSVTLALVGEGIDCEKTPSMDENCETEVYFQSTPTPKITVFSIAWEDETGTIHLPDYDITKVVDRLRAMYPINKVDVNLGGDSIVIQCSEDEACGPPTKITIFRELDSHWKDDRSNGRITENHIYYGFVDEVKGGEGGSADLGGNVAFTATATSGGRVPGATAHEIAHLHGLQHAVNEKANGTREGFWNDRPKGYCGSGADPSAPDFPYADSTRIQVPDTLDWNGFTALGPTGEELNREVWGVNTEEGGMGNVVASSQHLDAPNAELMSYCVGTEFGVLWASDTTYTTLRDSTNARFGTDTTPTLASANSRTPGSTTLSQVQSERGSPQEEDYLLVKGQLDIKEDTLEFRSFTTVTTTPGRVDAISPDPGSYTLQALDETGNVIEEVSFKPRIPVTKKLSKVGIFSVPLQADPAIEGVQVLGGGNGNSLSGKSGSGALTTNDVLGSKSASPNSPTVTVQYPNGGEDLSGDEVTLEWSADDADGDSLSYTVKYSRNGGSTWKALATSWPRDSLTVDAGALGGTSDGLIRVQASDGFNTAEDQSDGTFGTSNVPPSASIFSPSDGAVIGQSGSIALDGDGTDTEDGSLSGSALEWRTASGDSLGIGETIDVSAANFSLGTHTIELVATDSVGAADTASVSIQVSLSNDPSLLASASALVESDSLVGFGSTGTNIDFDNTSGAATVTAELYDSAPIWVGGIPESNVSHYRVLVDKQDGLTVGPETAVRFETDTLSGIGDPTKVQIYQRPAPGNGPFAALDTQVDSMGTPSDPSDDEIYATVDGFGEFVLASNSEPLPVELSGFEAILDDEDAVRLTWTTASETGNAGFEVQRTAGNAEEGSWTTVGSVEGNGTTTEPTSYRYVDKELPYEADRLTYRLKQVDTDGSASYSKTVTVSREVKEAELLGTYPNPARTQATLRYAVPERQDVKIYLYDILGRRVQTVVDGEREGRHKQQLDTSRLASGVYFLRLRADGVMKTQKLTVVR